MIVKLLPGELRLARYVAKCRDQSCKRRGITNLKRDDSRDDEEINFEGAAAEIAACKFFNVFPDLEFELTDNDYDLKLHDGTTVDVKSTHWANGRLLVAPWKQSKAPDAYILMISNKTSSAFRLAGGVMAKDLFVPENRGTSSGKENFELTQHELTVIEDLFPHG